MAYDPQIAETILDQINEADKWCLPACGARNLGALDQLNGRRGGLQFRVTITSPQTHHKIIIELTDRDEYKVQRIKIKRGSHEVIVEDSIICQCNNLAAVVYGFCNK